MRLSSVCQRVIKTLCTSPHLQSSTDVLLGCSKAAEHPHSTRPPPAFWEPAHNNSKVCAFKIPPKEPQPSVFHPNPSLGNMAFDFPFKNLSQSAMATTLPCNSAKLNPFLSINRLWQLLWACWGMLCWMFSFWQFSYCSGSQGWQQTLLFIFWDGIVLLKPELAFKRNETFHLPLIKLLNCDFPFYKLKGQKEELLKYVKPSNEMHNEEIFGNVWLQQCYIKRFNGLCGNNIRTSAIPL